MTCKRDRAMALKFYIPLLPASVPVTWREEMADVSAAYRDR